MAPNGASASSDDAGLQIPAFLARSLSDENRLRILCFLADGGQSVSRIVEALELSQPLVSHHLRELRRALLVDVERRGPFVHYRLSTPEILEVVEALRQIARDLIARRQTF